MGSAPETRIEDPVSARIAVLATGGTIASVATDHGVVATRTAGSLVDGLGIADVEVETIDLMTIGSYRMTLEHLRRISDAVADLLSRTDRPVDGIVITHGTDTMEETAILLDLVHDDPRPVVLTGAQRAGDAEAGDGPRNLTDAVRVAASAEARDHGVMIVFDGAVLPARGTRKLHTEALHAFGSVNGTELGTVGPGGVHLVADIVRPKPLPRPDSRLDVTRVDLVESYPGADDALLHAAVRAGATGIVLAGTGLGNTNPQIVAAATELVSEGIALVVSTRVPEGPVRGVYGSGGGADLTAAGIPCASGLPASQVRILLALWLSRNRGADMSALAGVVASHVYLDN
ncbi:L-asparaginase [Gordonia paraffinivorans]|nr:L-asparaginase [Gordonia paraffinivorans]PWD44413.1 L-asparaginase [Gordonia paraffinivorans]